MATIKTAISLEDALFRQAEGLARKMKVSRSRLFATALEEFIEHRRNQELLQAINAAYEKAPDPAEKRLQRAMRRHHRRRVQGQW
jgi:metal-responsive CopG/Arc/MetJ family transcriptional regulator